MQIAIPIIWRYLFSQYIKVLFLSIVAFIAILMTIRLNDIAHFASFGADMKEIAHFALNQMIYILPFAIPTSCLISAIILVKRLSRTHELTALRSFGLTFKEIFAPVLLAAAILSMINFVLVSETASSANFSSQQLKKNLRSVNPLILLHNKHLLKLRGIYFETQGSARMGEYAEQVILAAPNRKDKRLQLMLAKKLSSDDETFSAERITFISNLGEENEKEFDKMMIENIADLSMPANSLADFFTEKREKIRYEHMRLSEIFFRMQNETDPYILTRYSCDIIRRFSTGLAVFTFTFMGLAFGVSISRQASNYSIIAAIVLATFYLTANIIVKQLKLPLLPSAFLYFIPHVLIFSLSLFAIKRITKGVEK